MLRQIYLKREQMAMKSQRLLPLRKSALDEVEHSTKESLIDYLWVLLKRESISNWVRNILNHPVAALLLDMTRKGGKELNGEKSAENWTVIRATSIHCKSIARGIPQPTMGNWKAEREAEGGLWSSGMECWNDPLRLSTIASFLLCSHLQRRIILAVLPIPQGMCEA